MQDKKILCYERLILYNRFINELNDNDVIKWEIDWIFIENSLLIIYQKKTFFFYFFFRGHEAAVSGCTFNKFERLYATCSWDKTVLLYDATTGSFR